MSAFVRNYTRISSLSNGELASHCRRVLGKNGVAVPADFQPLTSGEYGEHEQVMLIYHAAERANGRLLRRYVRACCVTRYPLRYPASLFAISHRDQVICALMVLSHQPYNRVVLAMIVVGAGIFVCGTVYVVWDSFRLTLPDVPPGPHFNLTDHGIPTKTSSHRPNRFGWGFQRPGV